MNWPIKLQATSSKHLTLDRSLDQGYSRIKKNETRTYAQLNASRPRTVVNEKKKAQHALGTGGHGTGSFLFSRTQSLKHQATSFKPQAASLKLQATSLKLQDS